MEYGTKQEYIDERDFDTIKDRLLSNLKKDLKTLIEPFCVRQLIFERWDRCEYLITYFLSGSYIELEKKTYCFDGRIEVERIPLTLNEVKAIIEDDEDKLSTPIKPLIKDIFKNLRKYHLKPKIMVDFKREIFHYPLGNTMVLLDHDIAASAKTAYFLDQRFTFDKRSKKSSISIIYDKYLPSTVLSLIEGYGDPRDAFGGLKALY